MILKSSDSMLLLVDFQQTFLDKIERSVAEDLSVKATWLIGVAQWLRIPIFCTVEDGLYPFVSSCISEVLNEVSAFSKSTYNAAHNHTLVAALKSTGRNTVVVTGFETDICVAQSVIGLRECGFDVAVISDLVHAHGAGHNQGLERMRSDGVTLSSLRSVYYEWMADTTTERAFRRDRPALYEYRVFEY